MHTVYIYLYRLNGTPSYVGQAVNVALRHARHLKGQSVFERLLQAQPDAFSLEIVDSVQDVPHGQFANQQEDAAMDRFGTYRPESGSGYNFIRASAFGSFTEELFLARQLAAAISRTGLRRSVETRARISAGQRGKKHLTSKILEANRRLARNPEWLKKNSEAHKGIPQSEETRRKRSEAVKASWARRRT